MPADYTTKQGDSGPALTDTLTYDDGTAVDLTGATVKFIARALSSATPLALTGATIVTNPTGGGLQYSPTVADNATAGQYMGNWFVVFPGGAQMTFPTVGYISWSIEENLTTAGGQQIISLPELKDHLNIRAGERDHDGKLIRYLNAITPVIEGIIGPVIVRTFEEWHDGGQYFIQLRRRPSTALGSNPVLVLVGVDEYRGPSKYTLTEIADPSGAGTYSVMLQRDTATVYRRTTGGGMIPFGAGGATPGGVHVVYQAGQSPIPFNVQEAALEAIRIDYETTMPVGTGSRSLADQFDQAAGGPSRQVMSRVVRELLAPMRRHSAIA
jgi:hypothetical protein